VDRKSIRRYQPVANYSGVVATGSESPAKHSPPPRPPAAAPSACEAHRAWIEAQIELGRNAVSIYQDLVERHAFAHTFYSVKRFVATLRPYFPHVAERICAQSPGDREIQHGVEL